LRKSNVSPSMAAWRRLLGPDVALDAGNLIGADHLGMAKQPTKFRPGAPQGVGKQLQLVGQTLAMPAIAKSRCLSIIITTLFAMNY